MDGQGYIRRLVQIEMGSRVGNQNEVVSQCANLECQNSCKNPTAASSCSSANCVSGCVCAAGFLRSALHKCVRPENCENLEFKHTCSRANEVFSSCGDNGCERSCTRLNVAGCIQSCGTPACVCAEGFVRNSAGSCVLPSTCPPSPTCPGPNQVFSACGNDSCQRTCNRLVVTACNPICSPAACVCAPGFVRDSTGQCILPSTCPPASCNLPNEVFSTCGNNGCQRSCNRLDVTNCIPVCSTPGCICDVGFVRNSAGFCVIQTTCPPLPCSGTNEVFSFCGNDGCQRTCNRLDVSACNPVCGAPSCICAAGFVKNSASVCVAPASCTTVCTRANEFFSNCGNDGCQGTCSSPTPAGCVPICITGGGCICQTGFVRNAAGDCILPSTCLCGNDGCQPTCTTPTSPTCMSNCVAGGGCVCQSGFVINPTGNCVLPASCPAACPGPNQVFSSCGNDGCQPTCTRPNPVGCTGRCVVGGGCICQTGFVMNLAGACVNPSTCATTCPGANQVFSACGNDGCQATCTTPVAAGCVRNCVAGGGCICQAGFVKDANGNCIVPATCPATSTCPKANEMFSACGNDGCQATCTTPASPTCMGTCVAGGGCICRAGFVKNSLDSCVLPAACPPTTCPANQVFSNCGEDNCQRSCTRLTVPANCVSMCTTPGCICAAGFVKNALGACVPPASCLLSRVNIRTSDLNGNKNAHRDTRRPMTVTCPANEVWSFCGNDGCQRMCSRLDVSGCTPVCGPSACVCASGFVRNSATGACVAPSTCPAPVCTGANEQLSACGNDGCQRTCAKPDITGCRPICSTPSCVCVIGFVRNVAGACVLPAACPTTCTALNEVFSACGNNVCQATCAQAATATCTGCNAGCICGTGFLRNSVGVCVASASCNTCPTGETSRTCGMNVCEGTCATPNLPSSGATCTTVGACSTKCFCNTGLVRNGAGVCVSSTAC
ncbi:zonadhesin-like [Arctopsyche grandis]|uniref:zonadhesin-like n=1 Tax=Arctopsyche grandis TaxID=121162 RepID=UPI00406D7618